MRIVTAFALLALVGCGSGNPSASRLFGTSESVLMVVFGGNQSCKVGDDGLRGPRGMDMFAPFRALNDRLTNDNGWDVTWLVTCHNSDAAVKWVSSDSPNQIQSMAIADVAPKIEALAAANSPGHVYVAGHSYGGWLALKTGLALADDVAVEGLFTIDAISRPNCTLTSPAQCTRFPSDVTTAERAKLRDRTDLWLNFYQTQTGFLHSAPADEADQNLQVATSHTGIDTHENVWTKLSGRIAEALVD